MTSLRFVGDLPAWVGLVLAIVVSVLAWRYYRREIWDLSARLRVILPLLRAGAFALGILLLTGPVLHHRETIGELGKVQIYVDGSASMSLHDRHMDPARKLRIAEQLGWIDESGIDLQSQDLLDRLSAARRRFAAAIATPDAPEEADAVMAANRDAASELLDSINGFRAEFPDADRQKLDAELIQPLEQAIGSPSPDADLFTRLTSVLTGLEDQLVLRVQESIDKRINTGDTEVASALTTFDETPRWQRVAGSLAEGNSSLLSSLQQTHEVTLRSLVGNTAELVALPGGADAKADDQISLKVPDFSAYTDLSSGVVASQKSDTADAIDTTGNAREAIVLISDGQHNLGPTPLQMARILGNQGLPFYTVSVGASRAAGDLSVLSLSHPDSVFTRDTVRGVMSILDTMPAGQPFVAQVRIGDESVWQEELQSTGTGRREIEFEFGIDELVDKLSDGLGATLKKNVLPIELVGSVTPLATESEASNNALSSRLGAILQDHRLLILDGRSRWETRYLRNAFSRDDQWNVDTVIAGPGSEHESLPRGDQADMFPATREALFNYDLIIFGEIAPDLFATHELDWIREFVELRGGGLVFIDGFRGELQKLTEHDLLNLIPIKWSAASITDPVRPANLQLTDRGASMTALRLLPDEAANKNFWSSLPSPNRMVLTEPLAGSEVLAEAVVGGQERPAIVTRTVGAGRVLYLAFDETWRWRYKAADTWHQRVWNQLAKFTMPQPFAVSDEYLELDSGAVRYQDGDSVPIRARLKDLDGKPAVGSLVDAIVWKEGRVVATVSLKPDANVPGTYSAMSGPIGPGEYEVSIRASGYTEDALQARTEFVVQPPESGELSSTSADESLLEQIAIASGGQAVREEDMQQLLELLSPLSSGRVVESETLLWQSYWWFVAMILLFTAEWILRKRAGLL